MIALVAKPYEGRISALPRRRKPANHEVETAAALRSA